MPPEATMLAEAPIGGSSASTNSGAHATCDHQCVDGPVVRRKTLPTKSGFHVLLMGGTHEVAEHHLGKTVSHAVVAV